MDESVQEILCRPFDDSLIKTRPAPGGKRLNYVEGAEYIKRLNEVFEHEWNFKIIEHFTFEEDIVVKGELTVRIDCEIVTKEAFGGAQMSRRKNDDRLVALADDLKSAATDALKKASSLLGVGLHLYTDTPKQSNTSTQNTSSEFLTEKQLNAMVSIAKGKGWTGEDLASFVNDMYKKTYKKLTKNEASEVIKSLKGGLEGKNE